MIVNRFGLHVAPGGIPFLVQPRGSFNLISPNLPSPFEPQIRPRTARCPHLIDMSAGEDVEIPAWVDEPLAQLFLPTPRQPGEVSGWIHGASDELVLQLSRLSSPTGTLAKPIWWQRADLPGHFYGITNLGPLVWTSALTSNWREAERHLVLGQAFDRRVLIAGIDRLPLFSGVQEVHPFILPPDQPLEAIGAAVLRRYMQTI